MLGAHAKNNAVGGFLGSQQNQLPLRWQQFLTRSIRWLTSSTYRTCQVFALHGCTESAEDPTEINALHGRDGLRVVH
jgi:hypothetical protein